MALLFFSAVDDADAWRQAIHKVDPTIDFRVWPEIGSPEAVSCALVWKPPPGLMRQFPALKLIINLGAGVDHIVTDTSIPPSIPIARIVDPEMNRMMAHYVLLAVLRHHRNFSAFERARSAHLWHYIHPRPSNERTVGVMGLGQLGSAAAVELARQGFRVRGWSSTRKELSGVQCFFGRSSLHEFLSKSEILVVMLPLTDETKGIIDRDALAAMPKGACLVNVGRGPLVNTTDLLAALDAGDIAEATLDVFEVEPLPGDHPLWDRPQVLITPHLASIAIPESAACQVVENFRRAQEGLKPLNVIDRTRGY